MKLRILGILVALISWSFTCHLDPSSSKGSGIVFRITKPAALVLNEETAQVIQTAFHQATYPDIKGEKYVRFLGGVTYGLTNIHISDLSIENSTVDFKEDDAIDLAIQNVSASFKGTLSYGYVGAWLVKLIHNIDFEIDSSIDLQMNAKLNCENERLAVDTSDCYLTFHKLTLHLQGDRDPGWLKQLFTNFISFTLKLVLKSQVCKEINFLSQLLTDFIQDQAANFFQDGDIGMDIDLTTAPVIKSNYIETQHKGLLLYKNYTGRFCESAVFTPSLLTESRMLYFWFSEHVLKSLALAAFLDERLVLTIAGEELKEMFDGEELETHQKTVQEIFQGPSGNDSLAKVWSLDPPEIVLQPEGTVVKSTVAVELNVSSHGGEPLMRLYFEKEVTVTIQASYRQKKLFLHLTNAVIESKMFKCSSNITVNDETLNHLLEKIILAAGIPEVISRIETALTSLMDSRGLHLFEIKESEIITRKGYFIIQMDFSFPHHLLIDFLKTTQ